MNADELRALGLYHTADWGQTANTRAGSAGKVRAFSGSPFELLDAADAMRERAGQKDKP